MVKFFPYVTVITPNLPEVELLIDKKIHTIDDMKLAASCLKELGAKTVVVKGGNRLDGNKALDVLYNGKEYKIFEKPVLDKNNTGAGCTFASSIASELVKGFSETEAVANAKVFVFESNSRMDMESFNMQNKRIKKLTLLAILTALSVTFGFVAKIPTPTGLLTLVDAGIYFTAFYLGKKEGAIVGGLSAFLIDLLSSAPQWMFISLFIHGAQGYFAGLKGGYRPLGLLLATVVMVGGYALSSVFMYGTGASIAELVPNFCQNGLGIVIGWLLYQAFKRVQSNK